MKHLLRCTLPIVAVFFSGIIGLNTACANPILEETILDGIRAEGMGGARLAAGSDISIAHGNPALLSGFNGSGMELSGRQARYDANGALEREPITGDWQLRSISLYHKTPAFETPFTFAFGYHRPESRSILLIEDGATVERMDLFYGAIGFELTPGISLGASAAEYLFDYNYEIVVVSPLFPEGRYSHMTQVRLRSTSTRFGLAFDLNKLGGDKPVKLGFSVRPAYRMIVQNLDGSTESKYDLPWVFGLGIAWNPDERLQLALDVEHHQITGTMNHSASYWQGYMSRANRDITTFRLGVEQRISTDWGEWALRAGVRSYPTLKADNRDYLGMGEAVAGYGFTLGAGYDLGKVGVDVSWVIVDRWYAEYDKNQGWSGYETDLNAYSEAYNSLSIGLSYRF